MPSSRLILRIDAVVLLYVPLRGRLNRSITRTVPPWCCSVRYATQTTGRCVIPSQGRFLSSVRRWSLTTTRLWQCVVITVGRCAASCRAQLEIQEARLLQRNRATLRVTSDNSRQLIIYRLQHCLKWVASVYEQTHPRQCCNLFIPWLRTQPVIVMPSVAHACDDQSTVHLDWQLGGYQFCACAQCLRD